MLIFTTVLRWKVLLDWSFKSFVPTTIDNADGLLRSSSTQWAAVTADSDERRLAPHRWRPECRREIIQPHAWSDADSPPTMRDVITVDAAEQPQTEVESQVYVTAKIKSMKMNKFIKNITNRLDIDQGKVNANVCNWCWLFVVKELKMFARNFSFCSFSIQ